MTLTRAQTLTPEAIIRTADNHRYRHMTDYVLEILSDFSDRLDYDYSDMSLAVYVDLGSGDRIETLGMGRRMIQALQHRLKLTPQVGIASGKFSALIAAKHTDSGKTQAVSSGRERAFLEVLPASLLPIDRKTLERLSLLGVQTMGQLATLPREAIYTQFGRIGLGVHALASGKDNRRVTKYVPEQREIRTRQFQPAVDNRVILESALQKIAWDVSQRLVAENLTTRYLRLTFTLDNHTVIEDSVSLHKPVSTPAALAEKLQNLSFRIAIRQPVTEVSITCRDLQPAAVRQLSFFDDHAQQKIKFEDVLRDLTQRYGSEALLRVERSDESACLPERRYRLERVISA
jgi:DNA polymerase-4